MSDIPLRAIRRSQARSNYIPLADNDAEAGDSLIHSSDKSSNMPTMGVTKAAVSSSTARKSGREANRKMTGKDRYVDDPEEEERLLEGSYDGIEEGDEDGEPRPSPTQVYV